ncbi:pyridoxamine 5'-phosphate oxidase [Fusarium austroafricanum]|uniref:pyridoxal 5'-phosphate synthase n=1 Tax=Fusarium austroafricanum TaxID=2364996 RepID=A0A8H4NF10_9HYPO|nr:pyridoxamine 5'-phosphate oxidase [Fusarium austroafricanum]
MPLCSFKPETPGLQPHLYLLIPDPMASSTLQSKLRALPVLEGASYPKTDFDSFPESPEQAFEAWLDEAIEAKVPEPHALTLSTTDQNGRPGARVLILKNIDNRGWHFAIKAESPKGRQISANQNVALTFYWPKIGRQIRLRGRANSLPKSECEGDFTARSSMAKITAAVSKQSEPLRDPSQLTVSLQEAIRRQETKGQQPSPKGWIVYAVAPETVEFWQASSDRLHQRLNYLWDSARGSWAKEALWP